MTRTWADLKQMLKDRGLPSSGVKDILIDRLMQAGSLRTSLHKLGDTCNYVSSLSPLTL